jgi:hypothetical protein
MMADFTVFLHLATLHVKAAASIVTAQCVRGPTAR